MNALKDVQSKLGKFSSTTNVGVERIIEMLDAQNHNLEYLKSTEHIERIVAKIMLEQKRAQISADATADADPQVATTHMMLHQSEAETLFQEHDFQAAEVRFTSFHNEHKHNTFILLRLGQCFYYRGHYDKAITILSRGKNFSLTNFEFAAINTFLALAWAESRDRENWQQEVIQYATSVMERNVNNEIEALGCFLRCYARKELPNKKASDLSQMRMDFDHGNDVKHLTAPQFCCPMLYMESRGLLDWQGRDVALEKLNASQGLFTFAASDGFKNELLSMTEESEECSVFTRSASRNSFSSSTTFEEHLPDRSEIRTATRPPVSVLQQSLFTKANVTSFPGIRFPAQGKSATTAPQYQSIKSETTRAIHPGLARSHRSETQVLPQRLYRGNEEQMARTPSQPQVTRYRPLNHSSRRDNLCQNDLSFNEYREKASSAQTFDHLNDNNVDYFADQNRWYTSNSDPSLPITREQSAFDPFKDAPLVTVQDVDVLTPGSGFTVQPNDSWVQEDEISNPLMSHNGIKEHSSQYNLQAPGSKVDLTRIKNILRNPSARRDPRPVSPNHDLTPWNFTPDSMVNNVSESRQSYMNPFNDGSAQTNPGILVHDDALSRSPSHDQAYGYQQQQHHSVYSDTSARKIFPASPFEKVSDLWSRTSR